MLVEELGQKLNVVLYDHDDAPRADEFLGRHVYFTFYSQMNFNFTASAIESS
jgi:hypothetical protein